MTVLQLKVIQRQSCFRARNQCVKVIVYAYLVYLLCRGLLSSSTQAL